MKKMGRAMERQTGKGKKRKGYGKGRLLLLMLLFRVNGLHIFSMWMEAAFALSLRKKGYSYLTAQNFEGFLSSPWTLAAFLSGFLLLLLLFLTELCILYAYLAQGGSASVSGSLGGGFLGVWRLLKTDFAGSLCAAFFLLPYLSLPYLLLAIRQSRLLSYLLTFLYKKILHKELVFLLLFLYFFAGLLLLFTLPVRLKTGGSFFRAVKKSVSLAKEKGAVLLVFLSGGHGGAALFMGAVYGVCIFLAVSYVRIFHEAGAMHVLLVVQERMLRILTAVFGAVDLTVTGWILFRCTGASETAGVPLLRQKSSRLLTGLLTAGALFVAFYYGRNPISIQQELYTGTQVTAHRGNARSAPENTMAAIKSAVKNKADFVEVDVQETKDQVLVLLHDPKLKRTTGYNKNIWDVNYKKVRTLDAGSWFQEKYAGEAIPTLEQALDYCKGKIYMNIEIKDNGHSEDTVSRVVDLIEEKDMVSWCSISSVNYNYLKEVKRQNPELRTGYIMSMAYGNVAMLQYADFVSVKYTCVDDAFVEKAHAAGKGVHVWTVNSRYNMQNMLLHQVDNIITDRPQLALKLLAEEAGEGDFFELLSYMIRL